MTSTTFCAALGVIVMVTCAACESETATGSDESNYRAGQDDGGSRTQEHDPALDDSPNTRAGTSQAAAAGGAGGSLASAGRSGGTGSSSAATSAKAGTGGGAAGSGGAASLDAGPTDASAPVDGNVVGPADNNTLALPEGAAQLEIDISDHPEVVLEHVACNELPETLSVSTGISLTPSVVTSDGYVFLETGMTPDPLDKESSHMSRCDHAKELHSWSDYPAPNGSGYFYPTHLGAYAGGGALYGFNSLGSNPFTIKLVKVADEQIVWSDDYDGFLNYMNTPSTATLGEVKAVSSDSAVYVTATANQLPQEPPGMMQMPVLVKYTKDGERLWIHRFARELNDQMAADNAGNVYFAAHGDQFDQNGVEKTHLRVVKLDPDGSKLWTRDIAVGPSTFSAGQGFAFEVRDIAATGDLVYVLTTGRNLRLNDSSDGFKRRLHLVKLRASDGSIVFRDEIGFRHSKVIDPVEQVEWHGVHGDAQFTQWSVAPLAQGGVCLGGQYENTYVNGSVPRKPHTNALIACFDAGGAFSWARQYRAPFDPNQAGNGLEQRSSSYLGRFAQQPDASLLVHADQSGGAGPFVFAVSERGDPIYSN